MFSNNASSLFVCFSFFDWDLYFEIALQRVKMIIAILLTLDEHTVQTVATSGKAFQEQTHRTSIERMFIIRENLCAYQIVIYRTKH